MMRFSARSNASESIELLQSSAMHDGPKPDSCIVAAMLDRSGLHRRVDRDPLGESLEPGQFQR
jgi:hypothetical protein